MSDEALHRCTDTFYGHKSRIMSSVSTRRNRRIPDITSGGGESETTVMLHGNYSRKEHRPWRCFFNWRVVGDVLVGEGMRIINEKHYNTSVVSAN